MTAPSARGLFRATVKATRSSASAHAIIPDAVPAQQGDPGFAGTPVGEHRAGPLRRIETGPEPGLKILRRESRPDGRLQIIYLMGGGNARSTNP